MSSAVTKGGALICNYPNLHRGAYLIVFGKGAVLIRVAALHLPFTVTVHITEVSIIQRQELYKDACGHESSMEKI